MIADNFVPITIHGKVLTREDGKYCYGGHPVQLDYRKVHSSRDRITYHALVINDQACGAALLYFGFLEDGVHLFAPKISGGMMFGLTDLGELTDEKALTFVKAQVPATLRS